jgi:hypothetical protein
VSFHLVVYRLDDVSDSLAEVEIATSSSPIKTLLYQIPEEPPHQIFRKRLLNRFDVFVDDFIGMGQGNREKLLNLRRILLHTLDDVFRLLDDADGPHRKEPALVKQLKQGKACWGTRKLILGWIVDTLQMTIELPAHRKERLLEILKSFPATDESGSLPLHISKVDEARLSTLMRKVATTPQHLRSCQTAPALVLFFGEPPFLKMWYNT